MHMRALHARSALSPRHRLAFALAALLACLPMAAFAQQAQPIEREMSPQEFKAAGLDKLTPEELARLNAWLGRRIETATATAETLTKDRLEQENRGFLPFGSQEPIVAKLEGEFRGFQRGREYTLDNGQVWRQVDEASLVGARAASPGVRLTASRFGRIWYMAVDGYNTRAKVERVR